MIEQLFCPIIDGHHFFLYVFDIKKGNIHIIDNIARPKNAITRYKEVTTAMV